MSIQSLLYLVAYIAACLACLTTQNYFAISLLVLVTALGLAAIVGFQHNADGPLKAFAVMTIVLFLIDANSSVSLSRVAASWYVSQFIDGGANYTDRLPCTFTIGEFSFRSYMPGKEARNALIIRCFYTVTFSYIAVALFYRRPSSHWQSSIRLAPQSRFRYTAQGGFLDDQKIKLFRVHHWAGFAGVVWLRGEPKS